MRIATASVRTGFAMTGIFARGAVQGRVGDREGRPYGELQEVRWGGTMWASSPTDTFIANCQWPVARKQGGTDEGASLGVD